LTGPSPAATDVDGWLEGLGVEVLERSERDGAVSWDLLLDGRRRRDVRVTLILDPSLALVGWVHFAPPLSDGFRKSYRQFLRWNDELPFVKFALSADERPVLSAEIPVALADRESAGTMLARLLGVCDLLLDESRHWLEAAGKRAAEPSGTGRNAALLERHAAILDELAPSVPEEADAGSAESPAGDALTGTPTASAS
jgi:Putative bacterial sensory transduction regulator